MCRAPLDTIDTQSQDSHNFLFKMMLGVDEVIVLTSHVHSSIDEVT